MTDFDTDRFIDTLRCFAETLDADELQLLERLLVPAISAAGDDVVGLTSDRVAGALPEKLAASVRAAGLVVVPRQIGP